MSHYKPDQPDYHNLCKEPILTPEFFEDKRALTLDFSAPESQDSLSWNSECLNYQKLQTEEKLKEKLKKLLK